MNQKDHKLLYVKSICKTVSFELFGVKFPVRIERDCILKQEGRIFVQITYKSKCKQSNIIKVWHGRKWYLSDYMTEDEIIKTLYIAFKSCVEHEVMENFTVNGITLFNPHINYKELLAISHKEVKRK